MGIKISIRNKKKNKKMKFSLACLAAAAVADERKFSNNDDFMASSPPSWWDKFTPAERHGFLSKNNELMFDAYLPGKASLKLKPLFADLIADMARIKDSCQPGSSSRKRRSADEGEDPMAGGDRNSFLIGDVNKDIEKYTKNIGRWAKFMIFDQGGECEFLGERLIKRTDRLRWFMKYAYCKQTDSGASFCAHNYDKFDGVHPREHRQPWKHYSRPIRPEGGF